MTLFSTIQDFIAASKTLADDDQLKTLLADAGRELGFTYFALVRHVDLRSGSETISHLDNYPVVWSERFVANKLFIEDPVLHASSRALAGFAWAEIGDRVALTTRQRHLLENATCEGLGEGFTVPANVPGETNGSCSFATRVGVALPSDDRLLLAQLVATFAFEALRRIEHAGLVLPEPPRLSPRQRDCLLLAAWGKTDWEMAQILGLKEDTVTEYLDDARRRYDVSRRMQLAMRAVFDGQISLLDAIGPRSPLKEG